jgi:hypothetical protein
VRRLWRFLGRGHDRRSRARGTSLRETGR